MEPIGSFLLQIGIRFIACMKYKLLQIRMCLKKFQNGRTAIGIEISNECGELCVLFFFNPRHISAHFAAAFGDAG